MEAYKTIAYEIAEAFDWKPPDWCVLPVCYGDALYGMWKGFQELHKVGLIEAPATHMTVAQAAGCAPMVDAFDRRTLNVAPVKPAT